ncbi:MAG: hypothetical protein HXL35_03100 [Prevotellaceae bacterium]|nr:hypothetical protein [Prevotellaceae bacterium]
MAAVSNAADGRHTPCSTVAVCAADGRRTTNLIVYRAGQKAVCRSEYRSNRTYVMPL